MSNSTKLPGDFDFNDDKEGSVDGMLVGLGFFIMIFFTSYIIVLILR